MHHKSGLERELKNKRTFQTQNEGNWTKHGSGKVVVCVIWEWEQAFSGFQKDAFQLWLGKSYMICDIL